MSETPRARPQLAQADGYEPRRVPECIASPDGKHHGRWWCSWCSDELFGFGLRVILQERKEGSHAR